MVAVERIAQADDDRYPVESHVYGEARVPGEHEPDLHDREDQDSKDEDVGYQIKDQFVTKVAAKLLCNPDLRSSDAYKSSNNEEPIHAIQPSK